MKNIDALRAEAESEREKATEYGVQCYWNGYLAALAELSE